MVWNESRKNANRKYKRESAKLVTVQMPLKEWESLSAFCEHKQVGKSTLIRQLINEQMKRDNWTYTPNENDAPQIERSE